MWQLERELPQLYREFNGIDFGHAHIAETLLTADNEPLVEQARLEVLSFIFSSPVVPPDEGHIAPTFVRLAWEVQKVFHWAHVFHRSLYDLFASENVPDKESAYRVILKSYLGQPEAITSHPLDHHGKLWSWEESKAFAVKYPKFNTQIWAYHWLQSAAYDVQLMGGADIQRQLMPRVIDHYHGYLRNPPIEWKFMPMMAEGAPEFSRRFPEAAAVFDNLHMLHDNIDDILSSSHLFGSLKQKRSRILEILPIYLHRNHEPHDLYAEYHSQTRDHSHTMSSATDMGPRPPSAQQALGYHSQQHFQKEKSTAHDSGSPHGDH